MGYNNHLFKMRDLTPVGGVYVGRVPLILKLHITLSAMMINFACAVRPYSVGLYDTVNWLRFDDVAGGSTPLFGDTVKREVG